MFDLALRVAGVGTWLRRHGTACDSCIAGIVTTVPGTIPISRVATRIAYRARDPVAYTTRLPSAVWTVLACLSALLARLSTARELAALVLLSGL